MSGRFWPIGEAAQADYEALRATALAGESACDKLAATRFARRGLGGLIAWPSSEPVYLGAIVGAQRPTWSGHEDPRAAALGEAYGFLVARASTPARLERAVGR